MKQPLIALLLSVMAVAAFGQSVNKAANYQTKGQLDLAKEQIDGAVVGEKTKDKAKTWYYKGLVYESIATSDSPDYRSLSDDPYTETFEAYTKCKELDTKNGNWGIMAEQRLGSFYAQALNLAIEDYEAQDFEAAVKKFETASLLKPEDTTAYLYAGIAAQQGEDYDKALENYEKLIAMDYNNADIYESVIYLYRSVKQDNEKALEYAQMTLEKFPDNENVNAELTNLLILTDKVDEAKERLMAEIEANPTDANLRYNLAYIYDKLEDQDNALENYKKAAELDNDYFDANFNVAVIYYNRAADVLKKAADMDLNTYQKEGPKYEEEARGIFKESLPYLEHAHELRPDDVTVLQTLQTVYGQLRMNDKAEECQAKLEALGAGGE